MCSADIFLGLLAILFPPLPVWVKRGICSADSLINILLCMLGFLPGLIHAWYIIAYFPDDYDDEYERGLPHSDGGESGRVTYVFVQPASHAHPSARRQQQQSNKPHDPRQQPLQGGHANYGTADTSGGPSTTDNAGEGGSNGSTANPPPTYAEAVKGDYKVQTQD